MEGPGCVQVGDTLFVHPDVARVIQKQHEQRQAERREQFEIVMKRLKKMFEKDTLKPTEGA